MLSNFQIILGKEFLRFLISNSDTIFLLISRNIALVCHNLYQLLQQSQERCLTITKTLVFTCKLFIHWSLSQTPFLPQK